jgi:hypothetical protein
VVWGKDDGAAEDSASCRTVGESGRPENEIVSSSAGVCPILTIEAFILNFKVISMPRRKIND